MATWTSVRSQANFPEPHRFGLWLGESRFKVFPNLSLVKTTITNDARNGVQPRDAKVFEYTDGGWEQIYHIPKGSNRLEHELWQSKAPKTVAVSENAVQEAIRSILGNTD